MNKMTKWRGKKWMNRKQTMCICQSWNQCSRCLSRQKEINRRVFHSLVFRKKFRKRSGKSVFSSHCAPENSKKLFVFLDGWKNIPDCQIHCRKLLSLRVCTECRPMEGRNQRLHHDSPHIIRNSILSCITMTTMNIDKRTVDEYQVCYIHEANETPETNCFRRFRSV